MVRLVLLFLAIWLSFSLLFGKQGYVVYDVANDKLVADENHLQKLNIASNLKMFTSVVALQELGSDFRFETRFCWQQDTLFVQAGGDPTLVMEELYLIALELQRKGVGKVSTVVIDDMLYYSTGCRQLPNAKSDRAYNAPVSALALNYNTYQINKIGDEISVKTPGDYFVLRDVDELGQELVTLPWHGKTLIKVKKKSSSKNWVKYKRVYHPTNHFFYAFCHYLQLPGDTKLIRRRLDSKIFCERNSYIHYSKPLKEVLQLMNIYSSNFIAESLGCYLGKKILGDASQGAMVVESFIRDSLAEEVDLESCSGLGKNYLSVFTILKLLKYVWQRPFLRIDFFAGLPDLGKEGTLQRIDSKVRVKGKSGSLHNVSALSGLCLGKEQKLYLFAFVGNAPYAKAVKARDSFLRKVLAKF